jgi:hypothetical protein
MSSLTAAILAVTGAVVALLFSVFHYAPRFRKLRTGDEVRIWGGYSEPATWLTGANSVHGVVERFMPVGGGGSAALVVLRRPETIASGCRYLLLYLRFGRIWHDRGVVHVEAIVDPTTLPSAVTPAQIGDWVESHAQYAVVRR